MTGSDEKLFVIIVGLCLIVRRFNVLRFIFGLRVRTRSSKEIETPEVVEKVEEAS